MSTTDEGPGGAPADGEGPDPDSDSGRSSARAGELQEVPDAGAALSELTGHGHRDTSSGLLGKFVFGWCVLVSLAHIYFNTLSTLPELTVSAFHWGAFGVLCALTIPFSQGGGRIVFALDVAIAVAAFACAVYVVYMIDPLYDRGVRYIWSDWVFSVIAVVIALEFARRTAGWFIPVLVLIGLTYVVWWGALIDGIFKFPGLTLETTLFRSYFEVSGMFGSIARISSTFVFMFILFGAFSLLMADWAGGNLILAILFIGLASLVLGMGLPVTAAYIVLGTLSAPALYELINTSHLVDVVAAGQLPEQAKAIFMLAAPDKLDALSQPMPRPDALALVALVPGDFSSQLFEQALSPALLTTSLLSAHMIIFWLSQDSNVTPPVCLTAFAAAAIAKTPPMATGLTAWRIAKGLYIVPLLFAYTPFLSGDWPIAIEIFLFGTLGVYALAAAYEGYAEAPVQMALRPFMAAAGVALLWPLDLVWHLAAAAVLAATFTISLVQGRRTAAVTA